MNIYKNHLLSILYFGLSTLITWWFVRLSPLYISHEQMILSTGVAGGKWGIQILAGLIFLGEKRWIFIRNIGFVCFVGSCILLPYVLFSVFQIVNDGRFFIGSLLVAVVTMIFFYHRATVRANVLIKWWYLWLICLLIAVTLQLTVVFDVITFD